MSKKQKKHLLETNNSESWNCMMAINDKAYYNLSGTLNQTAVHRAAFLLCKLKSHFCIMTTIS
ncbi:hypothetical protein QFZ77_003439 [Paenibacillus sp. V4I3]|nr:hypothetical protein [Paenibacillus sp. V4I3]MDQ0889468.1 hypothetical protein [Paenibacillus sp. V4I9]